MANNFLEKVFQKMDFNTYSKIKNGCFLGYGTSFVGELALAGNPIAWSVSFAAMINLLVIYEVMELRHCEQYTKEFQDINKLYNEFIKNYDKLNTTFDLNNPVEICTLFESLLYRGYLSKGKEFVFDNNVDFIDTPNVMGANILNGSGVCRHIAPMLRDIYRYRGLDSKSLVACNTNYDFNPSLDLNGSNVTIEDWHHFLNINVSDLEKRNELIDLVDSCGQFLRLDIIKNYDKRFMTPCHVITQTVYDDKSYYLDPTQGRIYIPDKEHPEFLEDGSLDGYVILPSKKTSVNETITKKQIEELGKLTSADLKECREMVAKTKKIYIQNRDVFEKFYNENYELYEEVSNKLDDVKPRKLSLFMK